VEPALRAALAAGLVTDEQPSLDLFDLDYFRSRVQALQAAFPEPFFNHAMAVKAQSVRGIMVEACKLGLGAECASLQEARHSLSLGFPAGLVVFDSPVKTRSDLAAALELGLHTNLDNEREAELVEELLAAGIVQQDSIPVIGLRINPVVGAGNIAMISTAGKESKFGLPLTADTRPRLLALYQQHAWLTGLHIHVGSQGVPLEKFVAGCRVLMDFVEEVEQVRPGQIKVLDIGGGLSTSYTEPGEPEQFSYQVYRAALEQEVPALLTGRYRLVTEMGRSLFLKAGCSITRVEGVKVGWVEGCRPILLTHLGTNQFPRCSYLPHIWRHRFSLFSPDGEARVGETQLVDIAGPLCFQGDYLAREVDLPEPHSGDLLAILDTGAYTMSMYCKFNSIRASPVYGCWRDPASGEVKLVCYKERETVEECLQFWGLEQPVYL